MKATRFDRQIAREQALKRSLLEEVDTLKKGNAGLLDELTDANNIIVDLVQMYCIIDGRLNSQNSTTYAEAIEFLEKVGRVKITDRWSPNWVIAEWIGGEA